MSSLPGGLVGLWASSVTRSTLSTRSRICGPALRRRRITGPRPHRPSAGLAASEI